VDIEKIKGDEIIEKISDEYNRNGADETKVICWSNKRANRYNFGIRNKILWREEEICVGDIMMIVKNNYFWLEVSEKMEFIANGDIAEIVKIKGYEERYNLRFANVILKMIDNNDLEVDCKIILNTLSIEAASLDSEQNKQLYMAVSEDYSEIRNKRKLYQKIKQDPYFNALQVKFAYAVTCHKAQGGQWKTIFVDQGYFVNDMLNVEYIRWLYTALTRTTEKLYLVNFKDDFFA